jgi:hypothetical protein
MPRRFGYVSRPKVDLLCGLSPTPRQPRTKVGADIVLTAGRELRKTRLFRSHERAELVGAIADTRTVFEGRAGVMQEPRAAEREGISRLQEVEL